VYGHLPLQQDDSLIMVAQASPAILDSGMFMESKFWLGQLFNQLNLIPLSKINVILFLQ
jgi:hypothetical protein